ncbi:unnamed protein product [Toxocara canis]|uniref:DUF1214 domain-containing protein n=1 Tax=Toxocara canis TaxID=6265 RepID=A0A183U593_TOXCA|nr:unnamed protein product [Toxocara canis]
MEMGSQRDLLTCSQYPTWGLVNPMSSDAHEGTGKFTHFWLATSKGTSSNPLSATEPASSWWSLETVQNFSNRANLILELNPKRFAKVQAEQNA